MKVATVVGATGYVGSHIVSCLLGKGWLVRRSSRAPESAQWLRSLPYAEDRIEIHKLTLDNSGPSDVNEIDTLLSGADSVFFCAGFETQAPETIEFMRNGALSILRGASKHKVPVVVLTSSGGSTNPPGHTNDVPKNELLHWSDPDVQISNSRYSPAAKTLMEIAALHEVGRNQQNEVVDEEKAKGAPRLCIMNPNLILGPQLQPGSVAGNSLPWMVKILRGEAMNKEVPNDSMSIIDVRDLAELHVACAENEAASGRYFGVQRSWPWEEILTVFEEIYPKYKKPPRFKGEANLETLFDTTRRDSLGVRMRPLKDTMSDVVAFMADRGHI